MFFQNLSGEEGGSDVYFSTYTHITRKCNITRRCKIRRCNIRRCNITRRCNISRCNIIRRCYIRRCNKHIIHHQYNHRHHHQHRHRLVVAFQMISEIVPLSLIEQTLNYFSSNSNQFRSTSNKQHFQHGSMFTSFGYFVFQIILPLLTRTPLSNIKFINFVPE